MPEQHTNSLQLAAPLTAAKPPVLDKTAAAAASAISSILLTLRLAGLMPDIEIPPDVVLTVVLGVMALVAAIRARREGPAQRSTAEVVSSLVAEVIALREQAAAAAITTPLALVPEGDAPAPKPSELAKRKGG